MITNEYRQRVAEAFARLAEGNATGFLGLLAHDVSYTTIGTTSLSGTKVGRDTVIAEIFAPLMAQLAEPLVLTAEAVIADGDRVAVQARGRTRFHSGARYDNTYCFVFRFEGHAVVEVVEYLDTALLGRALDVPPTRGKLLRAMDLNMAEMFRDITRLGRGGEIFERPGFWMAASPNGTAFHNMVVARELVDWQELLESAAGFYGPRRIPWTVWTRAHADDVLEQELEARGFQRLLSMPAMALLSDPGTVREPDGLEIRPATDDHGLRDYLEISAQAYSTYGAPRAYAEDAFAAVESVCAPHIQGFVGYVGGDPVACAAVYVTHGVAGIGWVGTAPQHRGRGYAEAVTWAAIREGFRRGGSFANLQASVMGRPIYERMGFVTPSEYRVWLKPS